MPLAIIALILCVLFFFYVNNNLNVNIYISVSVFHFIIIIFLIYVVYPLVKILFKGYGNGIQRIIILLILIFLSLDVLFSSYAIIFTLILVLYLAIFLNFSSDIKKTILGSYIVSYPIERDSSEFREILNTSSFNVLLTVILLTSIVFDNLSYLDLYRILVSSLAIVLVVSSIFYGKNDKSIDY